jgi:hypothetical protein
MVQFFLKRSDSGSSFSSGNETQFISRNIYQSRYPPNTEHKPPWTWPCLTQLQIPIDMTEALLLIRHWLKNSSLICFVFGIDNSWWQPQPLSFLWQIFALWPQKKAVQIIGRLFWGKRRSKSHHIWRKKKVTWSHLDEWVTIGHQN